MGQVRICEKHVQRAEEIIKKNWEYQATNAGKTSWNRIYPTPNYKLVQLCHLPNLSLVAFSWCFRWLCVGLKKPSFSSHVPEKHQILDEIKCYHHIKKSSDKTTIPRTPTIHKVALATKRDNNIPRGWQFNNSCPDTIVFIFFPSYLKKPKNEGWGWYCDPYIYFYWFTNCSCGKKGSVYDNDIGEVLQIFNIWPSL